MKGRAFLRVGDHVIYSIAQNWLPFHTRALRENPARKSFSQSMEARTKSLTILWTNFGVWRLIKIRTYSQREGPEARYGSLSTLTPWDGDKDDLSNVVSDPRWTKAVDIVVVLSSRPTNDFLPLKKDDLFLFILLSFSAAALLHEKSKITDR